MGQEIESSRFSKNDFDNFTAKLKQETDLLRDKFQLQEFAYERNIVGFEIEAWLVSQSGLPVPVNQLFLEKLDNPLVVHELAAFNVELNSEPLKLDGRALTQMEKSFQKTWDACRHIANDLSVEMMMIGILPSVQDRHLSIENMSNLNRYRALNEQIIRQREGKPLLLEIEGVESIQTSHNNVMLESACTSLQLHLQTPLDKAAAMLNLSMIVSAPMVAVSANSPYLFGRNLWAETRIPLFEQSVAIDKDVYRRVTFGYDYIHNSVMECYEENLQRYPILVPIDKDVDPHLLNHLRFHNGTIWRWNRPLIGFDKQNRPHLRIEHRVIPSGPTVIDSVANAAFYFGLINGLEDRVEALVDEMPFLQVKDNFYQCAQHGLAAEVVWDGYGNHPVSELLLQELIPTARRGLEHANVDIDEIDRYIGIIEQRVATGQNGATWQRNWVNQHGQDMLRLTCSYMQRQHEGNPVHQWSI